MQLRTRCFPFIIFVVLAAVAFNLSGCDPAKEKAKKIVALSNERRTILDELYANYGGSELAKTITDNLNANAPSGNDKEAAENIANLTTGFDQEVFEETVKEIGRGEKRLFFTKKSREFFSNPKVIKKARRVYEIELQLEMLSGGPAR